MSVPLWPNGPTWAELSPEMREWVKSWTLPKWLSAQAGGAFAPLPPSSVPRRVR